MNFKEYWSERKLEAKERKKARKGQKKAKLTVEARAVKLMSILFTVFVIVYFVARSCSGMGQTNYDWGNLLGLTPQMRTAIELPVDEDKLLTSTRLGVADWNSCIAKLESCGIDVTTDENLDMTKLDTHGEILMSVVLNNRQAGSLIGQLIKGDDEIMNISLLEFEIFIQDGQIFERTVALINMSSITTIANLPTIYLTTVSEVAILSNSISILNSTVQINQLSQEMSDEIASMLNINSIFELKNFANNIINYLLNWFAISLSCSLQLIDGGVQFNPKT